MLQWPVQKAYSRFVSGELAIWLIIGVTLLLIGRKVTRCLRVERNQSRKTVAIINTRRDLGLGIAIVAHERGIPSKRNSSYCVDYVPALCTHRPSLLPIGSFSEASGPANHVVAIQRGPAGKFVELKFLEEVKVVTRFP